ncbi:metallophosphoesterase [Peptoniphilus sp. AGMB00490]|uniref:Metallophosphoesterase n=1 Tax=Peptoniphilus faecalis TaxID=2731255 RepID=A0A848RGZ6_9FIRM|nr:metallophosphoesterase [Peptoniphilus faecalis]NMW84693.1 metallophosphoesterase [Peptoniphilus faecalis]
MVGNVIKDIESQIDEIKDIERVLVLSDLHIPFHKEEDILNIVKDNSNVKLIVFAGDILDCFSVSSFPKEMHIPLYEELKIASSLLKKIDVLTPNTKKILFRGNHEFRFKKYLTKFQSEFSPFVSDDVLSILKTGFVYRDCRNIKKVVEPLPHTYKVVDSWYYIYKDLVLAHPTSFSKIPMRTCVSTYDYFKNQGISFNALAIGHTHKAGTFIHANTLLCELGCLCEQMDYANRGNVNYTPQTNGYGLFVFHKDKVDIYNSGTKFIHTGSDVDVKTS